MITNNQSENPKSVKGCKDTNNGATGGEEEEKKETLYKSNSSKDCVREPRGRNNFFGYSSRGDRGKNRGRSRDDFGGGRGRYYEERRGGGYRGRSGRRGRDDDSRYSSRPRFQEPLNKSRSDGASSSSSKYYNCGDYRGSKPGVPEDSRISSTLRRMAREDDDTSFSNLCNLLQDSLALPDNETYLRRSLDNINESLLEILRYGQRDTKKLGAAKCLGHVGFNLGKDIKRFIEWILRKVNHESNNTVREYLLRGVNELVLLDSKVPKLGEHSKTLMKELHLIMESTEIADIYVLTAQTVLLLTKRYPLHFTEFFHDSVDIIVGWHIDGVQPSSVADFSSECLKSLSVYWVQDVCFTVSFLSQILEDAQCYSEEVTKGTNIEPFAKATAFIRVFRAVFEGAREAMDPSKCKQITWTFHSDTITQIFNIVLKMISFQVYCPLIEAGNRCAVAIMAYLRYKTAQVKSTLFSYISKQLEIGPELDQITQKTLLNLISKVMGESGLEIEMDLVDKLFSVESFILTLRFTPLKDDLTEVYKGLLKRRDIASIKATYSYMVNDLDSAMKVISPQMDPLLPTIDRSQQNVYTASQVEIVIRFYFEAFKHMSKRGGSLIWIYLVKPSLFELLAVKIAPVLLPLNYPALYHTLLALLKSHSSSYGDFMLSSGLVNSCNNLPTLDTLIGHRASLNNSPTTNHLSVIITLIGKSLRMVMSEDTKLLILKWSHKVIERCKDFLTDLFHTEEMSCLIGGVCRAAVDKSKKIALAAAKSVYQLVYHHRGTWKSDYLQKVINLCSYFMNSPNRDLQRKYLNILPLLPSLNVIFSLCQHTKDLKSYTRSLDVCLYSAMNRGDTGEIQDIHFRKFMCYIFHGVPKSESKDWLEEMVCRCWAVLEFDLGQRVMGSERALLEWGAWHCAQLTVHQKLKTPLGKPAETLVSIESAIRELSKEVGTQKCSKTWKTPMTGQRVRLLVQFIEHLEKAVYNSVEGTASAMPPPQQGIKSFFMTNKGTCSEWLNRIRLALMFVCIHAGLATYAVRHGYAFLQSMVDANNTQSNDFETGLIYVGWALTNLKEPEAVKGLYIWAKETQSTKLPILKPLILKAGRRYEESIGAFVTLVNNTAGEGDHEISDSEQEVPSNSLRNFIADQLTESYLALNSWEELQAWKVKEKDYLSHENGNSLQLYKYINEDYVGALKLIEDGEFSAATCLLNWKLGKTPSKSSPRWNHYAAVQSINHLLARVAITSNVNKTSKRLTEMLESTKDLIDEIIKESVKDSPSELIGPASILKYVVSSLLTDTNYLDNQSGDIAEELKRNLSSPEMCQILWWSSALKEMPKRDTTSSLTSHLYLLGADTARKEGNEELARSCLVQHLMAGPCKSIQHDSTLREVADSLLSITEPSPTLIRPLVQLSKQLYSLGEECKAGEVTLKIIELSEGEQKSRALARLAEWFNVPEERNSILPLLKHSLLSKLMEGPFNHTSMDAVDLNCYLKDTCDLSEVDSIVGELLKRSATVWPELAKAWTSLAECGFSWAKKLASSPPPDLSGVSLPPGVDPDSLAKLIASSPPSIHLDDIDMEATGGEERFISGLSDDLSQDQIESLTNIWRDTHSSIYNYFTLSAYSYFKFLQIYSNQSCVVLATLRLVRLLVKHPTMMEPLYQVLLPQSPTLSWVCIVPQLFSRLSHPLSYPRRKIAELLVRIGTDYPHLITFPAVVGSNTGASTIRDMPNTNLFATNQNLEESDLKDDELDEDVKFFDDEEDNETYDDDESTNKDESSVILENSFMTIVDSLSKQCGGGLLCEVGLVVGELRRITVLWDELWLGTLKQRHADIVRRFTQLSSETDLTLSNPHLSQSKKDSIIRDKHRLILKPLLFVLEQLHSITSVPPETPHEQQFQQKFGAIIEETLGELREPANPQCPEEACNAVKRLEKALTGSSDSKPSVYQMSDISPVLASLSDTNIAMPGLISPSVTIKSVVNTVPVLATMTKPKKLIFIGSDGKEYTYLFKGLEDLHLDERIMQFLSTANSMLKEESLKARHYSVVPLGPRSGLISWVDSVTPIFSIYKRWQQRESKGWVARPSELFYSVLTPLLTEVGLKAEPMHRSSWPLYLLKKALTQLTSQTPPHLLSKELWCQSSSAGAWWQSMKLYSKSLAVMSMIGYIIGLGDRHLDNVMVNLRTGQVVHIDYNVCFEKGKTLRVPEKVPFRLTPNLVTALGVTGVEGVFRMTCEKVLEVLQNEKETLLTLLEAFVYDPLIDWTPMNEAGYTGAVYGGGRGMGQEIKQTRRQLEREVTLAMFSVRVLEISHQWRVNKEKVKSELSEFITFLEQWLNTNEKLSSIMSQLQEKHSQMAVLKEAEGQPDHSLYTLGGRSEKYKNMFEAKLQVTNSLKKKVEECDQHLSHYQGVVELMRRQELSNWLHEVNSRSKQDVCTVFDLIKEFLQNAGQNQMVLQCAESESLVSQLCCEQSDLTGSLIGMLLQYWQVAKNYPSSYIHNHRSSLYKKWALMLLEDMSPQSCNQVSYEMGRDLSLHEEEMVTRSRYYSDLLRLSEGVDTVRAVPRPVMQAAGELLALSPSIDELTSAVTSSLIQFNSKFLRLEMAATGSGEYLVNLMSEEGDWFLDDMVLISTVIQELLALLPPPIADTPLQQAMKTLGMVHSRYLALQELDVNVRSIIVCEGMQAMRREEESVVKAADLLDSLANSTGMSLRDLAEKLDIHLRYTVLGIKSPHQDLIQVAEALDASFSRIIKGLESSQMLAPGEMLLLGFSGLFTDLLTSDALLLQLTSLNYSQSWTVIDHIIDAKTYAMTVSSMREISRLVELVFSVKRILSMVETLGGCRLDAEGWKTGRIPPSDPSVLARPVRAFIADYVRFRLLGVLPHAAALVIGNLLQNAGLDVTGEIEKKERPPNRLSLDELSKKYMHLTGTRAQVYKTVEKAAEEWKQRELSMRRERESTQVVNTLATWTFLSMCYHWLHDHYLLAAPAPPLNRGHFMHELRKNVGLLLGVQNKIKDALEQQKSLITLAEQRLKWASGANPALIEVLSAFENSVTSDRERIKEEQQLAAQVCSMANWVLSHEALRTPTAEALANDTAFSSMIEDCKKAFYICKRNQVNLTPVEEGLVNLCPPPVTVSQEWISKAEKQVSDYIHNLNKDLEPMQKELFAIEDCIKNKSLNLRYEMGKHNRIVSDIKELFKTMIKFEDASDMGLDKYLSRYKQYTESMSNMTKRFTTVEPFSEKWLNQVLKSARILNADTNDIYEDLLTFSFSDNPKKEIPGGNENKKKRLKKLLHTKSVQEKNSYAVGVWRRIKLKLEGRDPDPGVKSSVQHQVKWSINEAMSVDNLAMLYEGWTPWV